MEYFNTLPMDITLDILSRVPTETVLECKLVSKTWNRLVSRHPLFGRMHLHHLNSPSSATAGDSGTLGFLALVDEERKRTQWPSFDHRDWWLKPPKQKLNYFEYDDENHESETPIGRIRKIKFAPPFEEPDRISFIGSINGLICLAQNPYVYDKEDTLRSICIFNPIIREYVMLPEIKKGSSINREVYVSWSVGFGYVSSTDEYKVIGIYMHGWEYAEVYIYTLGSGLGWRNLGKVYSDKFNYRGQGEQGIFGDGTFRWIANGTEIITYDFAEEKFCEYILPPALHPNGHYYGLGFLNGFWFYAIKRSVFKDDDNWFDIWLLKKKNENHDKQEQEQEQHQSRGWTKEFMVEFPFESILFAVTKSGGALTYIHNSLNMYDMKASTSKQLVEFEQMIHQVFPHKHTFLSLKELGEGDTKIMKSDDQNVDDRKP